MVSPYCFISMLDCRSSNKPKHLEWIDIYLILFGTITAIVICVPNILTISKGLSIAAKVNLITIAFILVTCSSNFVIANGSAISSSLGTLLSAISLMLYKSPLYQAFLAHFNSLHFKQP